MFRKLVKSLISKKKEEETRKISNVSQLLAGDIISFKERSELPTCLQGIDVEVIDISCYEYEGYQEKELTLRTPKEEIIFLTRQDEDGERYLALSKKLSHADIKAILEGDAFADVFDEAINAQELEVNIDSDSPFYDWMSGVYQQTVKGNVGFFHKSVSTPSGTGEKFIEHYCESDNDDFSLQIEVYQDGSTEVYAVKGCSEETIQDLWPKSH